MGTAGSLLMVDDHMSPLASQPLDTRTSGEGRTCPKSENMNRDFGVFFPGHRSGSSISYFLRSLSQIMSSLSVPSCRSVSYSIVSSGPTAKTERGKEARKKNTIDRIL